MGISPFGILMPQCEAERQQRAVKWKTQLLLLCWLLQSWIFNFFWCLKVLNVCFTVFMGTLPVISMVAPGETTLRLSCILSTAFWSLAHSRTLRWPGGFGRGTLQLQFSFASLAWLYLLWWMGYIILIFQCFCNMLQTLTLQDWGQRDVIPGTYSELTMETYSIITHLLECSPLLHRGSSVPTWPCTVWGLAAGDSVAHHLFPAALTMFSSHIFLSSLPVSAPEISGW